MEITCIGVDIPHPTGDGHIDSDAPQILFPDDWSNWGDRLKQSIREWGEIRIAVGTTAGRDIAIVIGHATINSVAGATADKRVFGFIVDSSTLKQLRKALDAAIAATEK
jgi:tetrahydromethanopterin S-methyltransferase subunit G